jgi:hypothetical protein
VSLSIRTFCNTDVDAICRVWNSHYADHGYACRIDPLRLEFYCLAKPYFDASEFYIAEVDNQVVGLAHLSRLTNELLDDFRLAATAVSALCVVPCSDEALIASELLHCCDQRSIALGAKECRFRPMLPDVSFYLGLGTGDSMVGTPSGEHRTRQWVKDAGYAPLTPTDQWQLDLTSFQPPVDRQQVQIRRGAHVNRQVDEPLLPWWQACALGHTEPTAFQLMHRAERRVLQDVLYWTIAPELQTTSEALAWLWPPDASLAISDMGSKSETSHADQLLFLIAESLRELQADKIDAVRSVSTADDVVVNQLLKRLGFRTVQSGVVFSKRIA